MPKINLSAFIAAAVIIGGFLLILWPKNPPQNLPENVDELSQTNLSTSSSGSAATTKTNVKQPDKKSKRTFEVSLINEKIEGTANFSSLSGEAVVINLTSDTAGIFKIDGTDKSVYLEENIQAELKFTPVLVGRFPFKFGQSTSEIGALEVFPKP